MKKKTAPKKAVPIVNFRLDEILAEKGFTVRGFALASGLNYVTVLRISRNETHGITLDVMARLCSELQVSPGDLFRSKKGNAE